MRNRKTPHGEGYTIRIAGRKLLKTTVLEQKVEEIQRQYEELVQQNELLRAKEAVQLTILQGYEMTLQHLGMLACQGADSNREQGPSFLPAVLLDVDALKLKETLRPHNHSPGTGNSSSTSSNTESGRSGSSNTSTSSDVSCAFDCSSSSSGTSRMQRLNAAITPSDLKALQGISDLGLADCFKEVYRQLGRARQASQQSSSPQAKQDLERAVDSYIKLCLTAVAVAEEQLMRVARLNLETMQQEPPPQGVWERAVSKAELQPHQRQHICKAFLGCMQQLEPLEQQQESIIQQLQGLFISTPQQLQGQEGQQGHANRDSTAAAAAQGAAAGLGSAAGKTQDLPATPSPPARPRRASARRLGASGATHVSSAELGLNPSAQGTCSNDPGDVSMAPPSDALQAAAGTGGSSSPAAVTSSSDSSGSVPLLNPAGLLSLEDAGAAEELLQELAHAHLLVARRGRRLGAMWVNLLDVEQHADVFLAAFPYITFFPGLCACVWQQEQQNNSGNKQVE